MISEDGFVSVFRFDEEFLVTVESSQRRKFFSTSEGINALVHYGNGIRTLNCELVKFLLIDS